LERETMGRKNQLKMTGLTVASRVERAAQRRLEKEEAARRMRLNLLKFLVT